MLLEKSEEITAEGMKIQSQSKNDAQLCPGNLPDPAIELGSPALQVDSLPAETY